MKTITAILTFLTAFVSASNGFDFNYGFKTVHDANADQYIVETKNISKYTDPWGSPPAQYWGPNQNNVTGLVTMRFDFAAATKQVHLQADLASFNFSNGGGVGSGSSSLWASKDGISWVLLLDNPVPSRIDSYKTYDQDVPANLLGATSFYVQARLLVQGAPNTSYTDAQFSRSDTNRLTDVFHIGANLVAPTPSMVAVAGGTLPASSPLGAVAVSAFSISKYETTWADWKTVRTWAASNGYDIGSIGAGVADNHPVQMVNWYDALKWCNAKSEMEGFTPVYTVSGATYKTGEVVPVVNASAKGYRLPTEAEWEWAARGGVFTHGYTYSGSNAVGDVARYSDNSGGGTQPVGTKTANELGLFDMSGNVFEWCWYVNGTYRRIRGGGHSHPANFCAVYDRNWNDYVNFRSNEVGVRYVRSSVTPTRPNAFILQTAQAGSTAEIDNLEVTDLDSNSVVYRNEFASATDARRGLNLLFSPKGANESVEYSTSSTMTRISGGKLILETTGFNQNGAGGYGSHAEAESTFALPENFKVEFDVRRLQWAGHFHFLLYRHDPTDGPGAYVPGGASTPERASGLSFDVARFAASGNWFQNLGIVTDLGGLSQQWVHTFPAPGGSLMDSHRLGMSLKNNKVTYFLDGNPVQSVDVAGWESTDRVPPVVSILSPRSGAKIYVGSLLASGTVTEADGKPIVQTSTNNGTTWVNAVVSGTGSPYSWSASLTAPVGAVTLQVRSRDNAKNWSPVSSRTFTRVLDIVSPRILVQSPTQSAQIVSMPFAISGSATDNEIVTAVQYRISPSTTWRSTALSGNLTSRSWSGNLTIAPGPAILELRALDGAGNVSAVATRNIAYPVAELLNVTSDASGGQVSSGFGGYSARLLGYSYTVTATPVAGKIFRRWLANGATVTRSATYTFKMTTGLKLAPEFIVNPFPAVAGEFNGLVGAGELGYGTTAGASFVAQNGFLAATVGGNGSLSGSLRLDGLATPFSGQLDGFGETTLSVARTSKPTAAVKMKLALAAPGRLTGNVTVGGVALPFDALPGIYTGANGSVSPLSGRRYNVALKPQVGGPAGYGYGSLTFSANGTGTFAGKLADGTPFSAKARSGDDLLGNWIVPVEVPLYTNTGILWGELTLPKTTPAAIVADVTGELAWIRLANPAAASFKLGIITAVDALGARYLPVAGKSLLTGASATAPFRLAINGVGRTPATLTANGTWTAANVSTLTAPPAGTTWTFTPATGLFTGNFTYGSGATTSTQRFDGLLLTKPLLNGTGTIRGAGFHTGGNSSAPVLLSK